MRTACGEGRGEGTLKGGLRVSLPSWQSTALDFPSDTGDSYIQADI